MGSTQLVSTKARHLRHLLRVAIGQQEIGRRIRDAREKADLTQAALAHLIGLTSGGQQISRYERGEVEVSSKRLRKIADATRQPMSFFVQEPEELARDVDVVARLDRIEREQAEQLELLRELAARLRPGEEASPQ